MEAKKLKVAVVGALGGHDIFPDLPDMLERHDKVILLGDYFVASNSVHDLEVVNRLQKLLYFQRQSFGKLELLIGALDIPYFFLDTELIQTSTRLTIRYQLHGLLKRRLERFKICYQIKNWLFSHGGFTNGWVHENVHSFVRSGLGLTDDTFGIFLNKYARICIENRKQLVWPLSYTSMRTDDPNPVQCEKHYLEYDMLRGFKQVTGVDKVPVIVKDEDRTSNAECYFINARKEGKLAYLTVEI